MFKPILLSLTLCCGLYTTTQAQTAPPVTPPSGTGPTTELSQGRRDTLGAIGSMYQRHRRGGKVWLGIGAGGLLALARVLASPNTTTINGVQTSSEVDGSAVAVVGGLFVGLPAIIGVAKVTGFSEAKENEVDRAYRSGQPLPRSVARKLKKKDF